LPQNLGGRLLKFLRIGRRVEAFVTPPALPGPVRTRGAVDHVILLDGTLGALEPGQETNIGRLYNMLRAAPSPVRRSIYYEAGVQWHLWRDTADVAMGRGINRQIRRTYGWLASHYRPGDRIFLFGYSRGAYAVRSLAGIMDQVGLLQTGHATERNVMLAWRYYQNGSGAPGRARFAERFCHASAEVEMIGVFDTVKALGVRLPLLWTFSEPQHEFHNHALSRVVRHGFHALALDETRSAFAPVLWDTGAGDGWQGRIEQMWFRGAHSDIGGQLGGWEAARPLANIPLVWMCERAERFGLTLPEGWRARLVTDATAPAYGTMRAWGRAFLLRTRRKVGADRSEAIHPTARPPADVIARMRAGARVSGK